MRSLLLAFALLTSASLAQPPNSAAQPGLTAKLVLWSAPGSLVLPIGKPDWKFQPVTAYDHANRLVALFQNEPLKLNASFILFPNLSGAPTAEGCRKDVMDPLIQHFHPTQVQDGFVTGAKGKTYPSTSYILTDAGVSARNVFAFAGNAKTCAEIHVSTVGNGTEAEANLNSSLDLFAPDLDAKPSGMDLFLIGSLLFSSDPESASPFYGTALTLLPVTPETLSARRVTTDQLVVALGMSGHLDGSRHFAEEAIKLDPDYPINYYNLACADAEEGNADAARMHLEQAFARKQNVLPGEHMPNPAKDDSFLKLRKNKQFWDYIQTLAPAASI